MNIPDKMLDYGRDQAKALLQEHMKGHTQCVDAAVPQILNSDGGSSKLFIVVVAMLAGAGFVTGTEEETELVGVYRVDPGGNGEDDELVPIDQTPPFVRTVARMPVAVANHDLDTAWALWTSVPQDEQIRMTKVFLAMTDRMLEDAVQRRLGRVD